MWRIDLWPENSAHHGSESFIKDTIEIAKEFEIEHKEFDNNELKENFPHFNFSPEDIGYFEPGAGYVLPEKCISAQLSVAKRNGATILTDTPVTAIEESSSGVLVKTADADYRASKLILTAGPWIKDFVPLEELKIYRQVLHWFKPRTPFEHIFIRAACNPEDCFYGFPPIGGEVKISQEDYSRPTTPPELDREVTEEERLSTFDILSRHLPMKYDKPRSVVCMYTVSPDCKFIIEQKGPVTVCSACSGHGFKHSAAVGELLARRCLGLQD